MYGNGGLVKVVSRAARLQGGSRGGQLWTAAAPTISGHDRVGWRSGVAGRARASVPLRGSPAGAPSPRGCGHRRPAR